MIKYIDYSIFNAVKALKGRSKKEKYMRDIITFDIETTSYNKEISFMYLFGINVNGTKYYGRTWNEFKEFIEYLNTAYDNNMVFTIWVHNLSFEFRFMEKVFQFDKVFATSPHKVIYADVKNVRFRCSYFMSNLPLHKLQSTYNLKTKKLIGDLDYKLIRHKSTEITEKELAYQENDVQLLYEYIEYMLKECGSFAPSKMPYTSTGFTRKYLRDKAREQKQYKALRNIIQEASPTNQQLYNLLKRCFAGGFTHCNWIYCKTVVKNVTSLDKTSFYPAIMCKEKFPRKFIKMKKEKFFELYNSEEYALIFDVCFFNLKAKTNQTIISKHKCSYIKNDIYTMNKGKEKNKKYNKPIFDNGRVRQAEILVTSCTELDFKTISNFYTWDKFSINNLYASRKRYLPKILIETVLDLYHNKTVLKDVEGMELEYQNLKAKLNALFGCCVTDIQQPIIKYDDEKWINEELKGTELIDYIDNINSILLYQTGVYITAYARHELLQHNYVVDDDVVYNDTDSIKLINFKKYENYFKEFDEKVKQQLYEMCNYYKIDKEKLNPCDIKGNHHFLGTLSNEGTAKKFKTLGCKRYIYGDKKGLHCTVAGIGKKYMQNYLIKNHNPFDDFNMQLSISENESGKNTHYYTPSYDEKIEITDYNGLTEMQEVYTGVSLIPQKFEINLSAEYSNFLTMGISIDGNNHCEKYKNINKMTGVKSLWD